MAKYFSVLCWLCYFCNLAVHISNVSDPNSNTPGEKFFQVPLREKCYNTEFVLVRIFLYSD